MNHNGLKVLPLIALCLSLTACGGGGSSSEPNTDGDSRSNAQDNCPNVANDDQLNTDANFENGDALGDACDDDDDADGVLDALDDLPLDPTETKDTDQDTIGDNSDNCLTIANLDQLNNDGDALGNACDAFIDDASETIDSDGDNIGDNQDNCLTIANSDQLNTDANFENGDVLGDACDDDKDADGVANATDDLPLDPTDSVDTDGDGYGNNNGSDFFPNDPTEWQDTDFDGVGDNADLFPNDGTEWSDLDGDQIGDNSDPDKDGDEHNNEDDAFPEDPAEWADNDPNEAGEIVGDGIGDNQDLDLTSTNVNSIQMSRMVSVVPNKATKLFSHFSSAGGMSIDSAGDVNNDGYDDLIYGYGSYSTEDTLKIGIAYLIFGQEGGWPASVSLNDFTTLDAANIKYVQFSATEENRADTRLGRNVGPVGDVNNDGIDDFTISALLNDETNEAFVIFGRETWPDSLITLTELRNSYAHSYVSTSSYKQTLDVTLIGDMNGDGIDDLAITEPAYNDLGRMNIIFGNNLLSVGSQNLNEVPFINAIPDGYQGVSRASLMGLHEESFIGNEMTSLGDINQDGYDDIAFSNVDADDSVIFTVLWGRKNEDWFATLDSPDLLEVDGFTFKSLTGNFAKLSSGDLNGDGIAEIVFGFPWFNNSTGEAYVVLGGQSTWPLTLIAEELDGSTGVIISESETYSHFANGVAVMEDTNGDGQGALLLGKPYRVNYQDQADAINHSAGGNVFKIPGATNWAAQTDYNQLTQEWFKGDDPEYRIGEKIIMGGDFNGDTLQDMLFLTSGSSSDPDEPFFYVVYGYEALYPVGSANE